MFLQCLQSPHRTAGGWVGPERGGFSALPMKWWWVPAVGSAAAPFQASVFGPFPWKPQYPFLPDGLQHVLQPGVTGPHSPNLRAEANFTSKACILTCFYFTFVVFFMDFMSKIQLCCCLSKILMSVVLQKWFRIVLAWNNYSHITSLSCLILQVLFGYISNITRSGEKSHEMQNLTEDRYFCYSAVYRNWKLFSTLHWTQTHWTQYLHLERPRRKCRKTGWLALWSVL